MKLNLFRRLLAWLALVLSSVFCLPVQSAEKTIRINLGTLAPRGSLYHQSLQAMAESWKQSSAGSVRLVIYPDGTQGGEADMVRLMRVGSLQGGLLTAVGLSDIEPMVGGLQNIPMEFRNLDEFSKVSEELHPSLEKRLGEKGFVVLFWVDTGWVRYFSKEPLLTPEDLRKMKVFVWAGSPDQVSIMRRAGYTPVPLEPSDILPGLQTGLINAVLLPPIFALATQVDLRAPHMLKLNWAPLVGACVVKKDIWEKVPAASREALLTAAHRAGKEIGAGSRKESDDAIAAMQKRGLKVQEPTSEVVEQWRKEAEKTYPELRGTVVPAQIFDEVQQRVREYRAAGSK
jgi:TRAP-type transport system periplasmic protein